MDTPLSLRKCHHQRNPHVYQGTNQVNLHGLQFCKDKDADFRGSNNQSITSTAARCTGIVLSFSNNLGTEIHSVWPMSQSWLGAESGRGPHPEGPLGSALTPKLMLLRRRAPRPASDLCCQSLASPEGHPGSPGCGKPAKARAAGSICRATGGCRWEDEVPGSPAAHL